MKALQKNIVVTMGSLLAILIAGCATAPVPQDLLDARSAYLKAQSGPATQYKPDQVHEAKVALDKAEQSYVDDPGDQKTKDLAYVAHRKAELAEANAANAQAQAVKGQADNDAKVATKGQLAQTRGQLANANVQLAGTEQKLEVEKKARADADKKAKEAMDRLAASMAIKQEPRGMVITLSGSVLFASNKDQLLPAAQERLGQVAEALKTQDDHKIVVEGHTDSQGSATSNQGLSDRRAQAVVSYLVSRGVPAEQIRAEGLGPTRPIADNTSAEGRANNRRVEIIVKPVEGR
ncbi:MAG TPA: OmpA family protein [Polyangiaceae bacterium]|jgi:outer membrane protein OmpA-like peptidoglycan-associated protein|nr:OmpA family protein [Polyangiaceae bacterium]